MISKRCTMHIELGSTVFADIHTKLFPDDLNKQLSSLTHSIKRYIYNIKCS